MASVDIKFGQISARYKCPKALQRLYDEEICGQDGFSGPMTSIKQAKHLGVFARIGFAVIMKQKTIVIFSTTDWDAPQFGSRQQIALRLARRHRVLYVDQPRALHSLISDRQKSLIQLQRWLKGGLRQPIPTLPNLHVYAPPPVLPIFYHAATNAVNQQILKLAIRRTLRRLGWQVDIFWTYWANSGQLVNAFGEKISVYHCIDNYRATGYPLVLPEQIVALEETLCHKVDLVLTRTQGLADMLKECSQRLVVIGGGVDTDLFDFHLPLAQPGELRYLKKPLAGLVGTLDDRLDIPLLQQVAQGLPEVTFVLAGPLRAHLVDISPLTPLPNVHLLPTQPYGRVPAFIAHFDVCLIPYKINDYTREVSPLKLYEFLAMGKHVVATPLPYVRQAADYIYLAESADQFMTAIQQALIGPPPAELQASRRRLAESYSWDRQIAHINDILNKLGLNINTPPLSLSCPEDLTL